MANLIAWVKTTPSKISGMYYVGVRTVETVGNNKVVKKRLLEFEEEPKGFVKGKKLDDVYIPYLN